MVVRCWAILVALLLVASGARGACHVATPTGSGAKTGADWNNAAAFAPGGTYDPNALTGPSVLTRGDTYYLGTGNYGFFSFWQTPDSGSLTITIKAVTDSDNCTSVGYVHATFFGPVNLGLTRLGGATGNGDYWDFEGNYGASGCSTSIPPAASNAAIALCPSNSFGIIITCTVNSDGNACLNFGDNHPVATSHSVVNQVEIIGLGADPTNCDAPVTMGFSGDGGASTHNVISNSYIHNAAGGNIIAFNDGANTATHNWLGPDKLGSNSACHSEDFGWKNPFTGGSTVSYNVIVNPVSTAAFATPSLSGTIDEIDVYGNQVILMTPAPAGNAGNGLFEHLGGTITKLVFVNNGIYNFKNGNGYPAMGISVNVPGAAIGTLVWENNVQWNNPNNATVCASGITTCTWDHNSYFSTTTSDATTGVQVSSSNPFVNARHYVLALAGLADPTSPGVSQSPLFTLDFGGKSYNRGAWSRGPFAFAASNLPPLNPTLSSH